MVILTILFLGLKYSGKLLLYFKFDTGGLYYKQMMIVNNNPSIISQWISKFIDDARVVIYNRNMFIILTTEANVIKMPL